MKYPKASDITVNVILPLLAGCGIYLLRNGQIFPGYIVNYFPDGFWAYSLQSSLLIVWNRQINFLWNSIAIFFMVLIEILQYLKLIPGTGDIYDIIVYIIFFSIAIILNNHFNIIIYTKHEKN